MQLVRQIYQEISGNLGDISKAITTILLHTIQ